VEQSLPGLHPLYQFLDPIKRRLISDSGCHALVIINLLIDLNALLAHGPPFQAGDANRATCWNKLQIQGDLVPCSTGFRKWATPKIKGDQ
jgi:hypothetical protein